MQPDPGQFADQPDHAGYPGYPVAHQGPGYPQAAPAGPPDPRVSEVFGTAWKMFVRLATGWVPFLLTAFAVEVAAFGLFFVIGFGVLLAGGEKPTNTTIGVGVALMASSYLLIFLAQVVIGGMQDLAALRQVDGEDLAFRQFFTVRHLWRLLGLALVVGIAATLSLVTIVGPIVIALFTAFAPFYVIDRDLSVRAALGASYRLVRHRFGPMAGVVAATIGINLAGGAVGIGGLITGPVTVLMLALVYRRYSGTDPLVADSPAGAYARG